MTKEVAINYSWNNFVNNESRDAYYQLYQHYYAYLGFLGIKKNFSAESVKDGINDVFLYFWEKRIHLRHIRNPHNYIVTFFLRRMIKGDNYGDVNIEESYENELCLGEAFCEPSFESRFFDREREQQLKRIVRQYLDKLPPKQKTIVYQKFYLGLSYAEIAKAGGISVNTAYNTVYAAMDKLRSLIPSNTIISLVSLLACFCTIIF